MNLRPENLFFSDVNVSSLPIIYTRINEAVNNPRSSTSDITDIISDDPGLTSRLLQLVNSAFYNYPGKINTISRALFIVGTQQLRDLAMGTTIINLFKGISKSLVDMDAFWRHSLACGIAAKILATYRRTGMNSEQLFVSGIVHDIGRLIMYEKKPDLSRQTLLKSKNEGYLLYDAERQVFDFTHSEVGRLLTQYWKLPVNLEEVVAFHHRPQDAQSYPLEVAIIHIADIIVHGMQLGSSGERRIPPLNRSAWDLLGLSTGILSPLMEQLERELADVQKLIFGTS
jgi:HD-like signal output (HDOD) protein